MKKLFTLIALFILFMSYHSSGQSVRMVLAEEFTQASCPPCATQNPTFNNLLNTNSTKVCAIKYQTSWPGSDPMNAQTQALVGPRVTYYGVSGVPCAMLDGQEMRGSSYCGAPANWVQSKIDARQAITSPYDLTVTHNINATQDSMHITVNITATGTDSGTLVLHLAMIERDIPFCSAPGTNGETVFEGVMRKMIPNSSGTSLSATWTVGQTQTLDFDVAIPAYVYDKNTLAFVAFIQDNIRVTKTSISATGLNKPSITVGSAAGLAVGMYVNGTGLGSGRVITAISGNTLTLSSNTSTTVAVADSGSFYVKDVRQAAYSEPQLLTNDAMIPCDAVNVPLISCGNPITPTVEFTNTGSATLTTLNLDYTVDGVAQTAIAWTGSVASGTTGSVTIPSSTLNTAIGNHTINVTIKDPNGSNDVNVYHDSQSMGYKVYASVGTGSTISQAFSTAVFPPANWTLVNNDAGPTWSRAAATAGVTGSGSAKMDFYGSAENQIDELYIQSFDFSDPNIVSITLDFDQAYRQFELVRNDKLEVLYSIDCGQNWLSAYSKAGAVLAMGNTVSTAEFLTPTQAQWHHEMTTLPDAVGESNVFVKFTATSAYGNNAFVDNINVNAHTTAVNELFTDREVSIYPNPSTGLFNIQMNFDKGQDVIITVSNALGAKVKTVKLQNVVSDKLPVDITDAAKGTYTVTVQSDSKVVTKRITITE